MQLSPNSIVARLGAKGYGGQKKLMCFLNCPQKTVAVQFLRITCDCGAILLAKERLSETGIRPTIRGGVVESSGGSILTNGRRHQRHELLHRHRGGNHTNEVAIAANIDQTETETAVLIKRQMIMFLVCCG